MRPDEPLPGVAQLADRAIDVHRAARVMAVIGIGLAFAFAGLGEYLLSGANEEPEGGATLRRLAQDGPVPEGEPAHVAVVLIDGLRADEAGGLSAWSSLLDQSTHGVLHLRTPTLSRPFQHHAFTGVATDLSGVRTNRFDQPARHDSVMDRVRAAGGHVFISAQGLDWIRLMHGDPEDGGSDDEDALGPGLDDVLRAWREAPAPSLLVVHFVDTDGTAHHDGVDSASHREALEAADRLIARVAAVPDATLMIVSDHGHRDNGGHGGDEPEVALAPWLIRPGPTLLVVERGVAMEEPVDVDAIAPTLAHALGVARPRSAMGEPLDDVIGRRAAEDPWLLRGRAIADATRDHEQARLASRRRLLQALALLVALLALGPIKRAFGFERSMILAVSVPFLVVAGHLALDRPLTLSAIDERGVHFARVFGLGAFATYVSIVLARIASRDGDADTQTYRAAATAAWSALSVSLFVIANSGVALGPWWLNPRTFYLPLLACGAGSASLAVASAVMLLRVRRRRRGTAGTEPAG